MLEFSIFAILSVFMLGGAIAMIANRQPLFSAFGFLITMIALGGMFGLLGSQFLAISQIMVSVGAVVVLSMLTILTVNIQDKHLPHEPHKYKWIIFSAIVVTPFTVLLYKTLTTLPDYFSDMPSANAKVIGELIFSKWVFPFEILSILLLAAMVGAIVIARKNSITKEHS